MEPLVSVILPIYNTEKYISEAIESIFQQTYKNIELIVIDDGSTDFSRDLIKKKFVENKSPVKTFYFYQENQGPSSARNYGISHANGDYIAFLDADDLYINNKIEEQIIFLENNREFDIVYNDVQVVDETLRNLYVLKSERFFNNKEDFLAQLLFRQIIPTPQTMMLRKKCFENGIRYNTKYIHAEDYDLTIQLAKNYRIGYLSKTLYLYRRHEMNLTNNLSKQEQSEKSIVKNLGIKHIQEIVDQSNFPLNEKQFLLSKIFYKIEDYSNAEKVLIGLTKSSTINPYVYFYLGNCSFKLNQLKKAEEYYLRAILYDLDMAEAYNNLGCSILLKGEEEKAKSFFRKALLLRPNYMDAAYNLKQLMNNMLDLKLTEKELRKTLIFYFTGN